MSKMNLCQDCFYYSRTRYGFTCSFDGTFNPHKTECENYRPIKEAEEERRKRVEATKLVISMLDKLAELQPQLEKVGDEKLRNELLEFCTAAKQVKALLA